MELPLPVDGLDSYKSLSQRARVATEAWASSELYCPNCSSSQLVRSKANTPAVDYTCPECEAPFQLKSQSRPLAGRLTDAAYENMREAIVQDRTPNLFAMHYELEAWHVRNLILVPRFAFTLSILEKRKPLSSRARRAGWVGCNIVLANVPQDARIPIVFEGRVTNRGEVRRLYARLKPLSKLTLERRGWTLDVLSVLRSLGKPEFGLSDAYAFERHFAKLHPANRHIRDKIRQQLQLLRDLGFVEFPTRGRYRLL